MTWVVVRVDDGAVAIAVSAVLVKAEKLAVVNQLIWVELSEASPALVSAVTASVVNDVKLMVENDPVDAVLAPMVMLSSVPGAVEVGGVKGSVTSPETGASAIKKI